MRFFLVGLAVTGLTLTVAGAVTTTGWLVLVGLSALVIAVVMTALALPSTLRSGRPTARSGRRDA
ncbi:hypothetical protein AMIS_40830 [Actinoplanes missouriensis 431]|uniref:Uncharacterized protein n=1 Tax=Actinoplanes missouriensis (strain ATCC 14538 / DSM 43046 / CBS 188.64 / JCM 3121 / NBRC 102363 / NCIMB 12654 / NRRL B-3342 / UNCC 431) TaxID=512565 RepID=I0H8G6_ACTM4|nr:hypothetical protein [Actinoplanes missouriensis]BAL89303.1 hypothetical protein AMIS_40830 [Actinoplanes missouriensis 431]